jgi:hypothetical protein
MDNTVSTSQIGNIASNITRDVNKFNSEHLTPQTVSLASMMPKPGKAHKALLNHLMIARTLISDP